jgi:hypothetical protein
MGHIQATGFYMIHQWYAIDNLVATTISDTQIDLAWNNLMSGMTGIIIEISYNGIDYTQIDFIDGDEISYNAIGLSASRQYWFRIRGVKGGYYSEYSSSADDWTAWKIVMSSRGTGGDRTWINDMYITYPCTALATIDGTGKFYSDQAGTLDESTSITLSSSKTNFCVRVSSGSSNLLIFQKNTLYEWGQTGISGGGTSAFTEYSSNSPLVNYTLGGLPRSLIHSYLSLGSGSVTGTLADLPSGLLDTNLPSSISGNIADIPRSMVHFYFYGTISGNISDLPSTLKALTLSNGSITGSLSDFPKGVLERLQIYCGTLTGDISELDGVPLTYIHISGANTISGDYSDIPSTTTTFKLFGSYTLTGDTSDLPSGLTTLQMGGTSATAPTGDVADLPSGLTELYYAGATAFSGDVADLPRSLIYLTLSNGSDTNTLSGDISDLPTNLYSFDIRGNNTIGGDISDIPSSVRLIILYGSNTLTGVLSGISGKTIYYFLVGGANTISGNLSDLPSMLYQLYISGNNTIDSYTSGHTWSSSIYLNFSIIPVSPGGLSFTEIDNLIIDLSTSVTTMRNPSVSADLRGANASRTSASDSAIALLNSIHFYVITN